MGNAFEEFFIGLRATFGNFDRHENGLLYRTTWNSPILKKVYGAVSQTEIKPKPVLKWLLYASFQFNPSLGLISGKLSHMFMVHFNLRLLNMKYE